LDKAQFALPGQTCNNAVLSKILFLDLARQTLSPKLSDYDAPAAFDIVLLNSSVITCQRLGFPRVAGLFMFNLLKQMSFSLVTSFGRSTASFNND
jgi:hypothetical protein